MKTRNQMRSLAKAVNLTEGNPLVCITRFALPLILGNIFQLLYTLADSIIVGKALGSDSLAAVGATSMVISLVMYFIQGSTTGFSIHTAQKYGAGDKKAVRESVAVSLLLSAIFSLLLTLVFCGFSPQIMYLMKIPDNIYQEAYEYMFIILLGTFTTVYYNMISNILRAFGDSTTPLVYLIISSILHIGLAILFVLPLHMGVAGAAWATVLSQLVSAVLCLISGIRHYEEMHLHKEDFKNFKNAALAHLRIGLPLGFQMSVMCIGQIAMQISVNAMGSAAIAGYTAAAKVDQLCIQVDNALGSSIATYVSQNYGALKWQRIKDGVRISFFQMESINAIIGIIILIWKTPMVSLFLTNPSAEILYYANGYLTAIAPSYLLVTLIMVYRTAVQSMDNTRAPFAACIIELIMRSSSTLIICHIAGYVGVCLATPLAWIGASLFIVPVYFRMMKKLDSNPGLANSTV